MRWARTAAAAGAVAMLCAGCAGEVPSTPPAAEAAPDATVAAPTVAAPAGPPASFDGLQTRTRQAVADSGATIGVAVLDRETGEFIGDGADRTFPIASVVKLFIADDLLLQASRGETDLSADDRRALDVMLRSSDDNAAETFWQRSGRNAIIARVKARYGLAATLAPYDGNWDVAQSTAGDLVRYYSKLLDGSGGLPRAQADVILGDLARSTPLGIDGYPQRFGIPEGLYAEKVAVKQGWFCCWSPSNQVHVSTGTIGPDRRYVMAIGSLQPVDDATARETITEVVRTMFPGGRI
ncbi:serine hydrolase [Mycobacterium sp. C31M]